MKLSEFDYELPKEMIAQEPANPRDSSKLMVVRGAQIEHKTFGDILSFLEKDDVLVLNETKVEPTKLLGKKSTGGNVELLVSRKLDSNLYECSIKGRTREGTELEFADGVCGRVVEKTPDGLHIVEFDTDKLDDELQKIGEMPLPPYIKKKAAKGEYQTVYAKKSGSIAAPTAGFHFTPELLKSIEKKGVKIAKVTLHVGYGTFLPVKTENIEEHKMHQEWFEITPETAEMVNKRRRKLIVVGTTSLRALESAADSMGVVQPVNGYTSIFIYPGHKFKLKPDMMITNFHLPKSTLLMLVSALVGREVIMKAYQSAIENNYRFFSFGDAMLLFTE
jgi:S-adenosylmethionine:tRNA ribosyltransferase-isomerase